jgi:amino acid permease
LVFPVVYFVLLAVTVWLIYQARIDWQAIVAICWLYGISILVFVGVSILRAPWELDRKRSLEVDELEQKHVLEVEELKQFKKSSKILAYVWNFAN